MALAKKYLSKLVSNFLKLIGKRKMDTRSLAKSVEKRDFTGKTIAGANIPSDTNYTLISRRGFNGLYS